MPGGLETKTESFFGRIKKSAKKIGLVAGASLLALLAGCSDYQYRARVQTKPPEEVKIYIDGLYTGKKTSKEKPVYVESSKFVFRASEYDKCKISLEANNYDAFFIMSRDNDLYLLSKQDKNILALALEERSKNCTSANATRWKESVSYDLVFEIPKDVVAELHKKYTEWGDEIKEEKPEEKTRIKEYVDPKDIPVIRMRKKSLDEQLKELQLREEKEKFAWRKFDKKGWFGQACLNFLVPGTGHLFYESYVLGGIHLGIDVILAAAALHIGVPFSTKYLDDNLRNSHLIVVGTIAAAHALECFFETIFVARSYNLRKFREKYPKVYVGYDPDEKTAFVGINYKF